MEKTTPFSKRFVVSATALTDRYRHNPYAKSTVNIILLQVILTIIVVGVFAVMLRVVQERSVEAISESITNALATGAESTPRLGAELEEIQLRTFLHALFLLLFIQIVFGFLAARFALRPTKNSLEFQKRFISNLAHEVRTPLSVIKTTTEVALMNPALSNDAQETFTMTLGELDRISETINNLLSFNTLIQPSNISFDEVDLSELVEGVVERHQVLADSRGVTLTFQVSEGEWVWGNATGLEQVLTNLVKNGVNYTPEHSGGSVRVTLSGDSERAVLSVIDTGIGIARRDLYNIFEPFYRANTSRTHGVGGAHSSGLGLAIVNEIVRLHGGKISVRSAVGRGTTIEVKLPKRRPGEETLVQKVLDKDADDEEGTLELA